MYAFISFVQEFNLFHIFNKCSTEKQHRLHFSNLIKLFHFGEIATRIKRINDKLQCMGGTKTKYSRMTSFPQWEVVGGRISEDADEMIKLLFAATKPGVKFLVFGITGKGGIGKTTLARRIYDNRLVQAGYQVKVWLSISDEDLFFSQMLRETIHQAGGWCCGDETMSELEEMLVAVVQGKRLFLVFDGVFNLDLCNQLLKLVTNSCGDGSRVFVISRFDDLARELGAVHLHKMSLLSETESWSLACKMFDFQL